MTTRGILATSAPPCDEVSVYSISDIEIGILAPELPWCRDNGILLQYIQPGKPNQNACIERFNRTYRNEVLNLYLFRALEEVREITGYWRMEYNSQRPHDALGGLPPEIYSIHTGNSTFELSA